MFSLLEMFDFFGTNFPGQKPPTISSLPETYVSKPKNYPDLEYISPHDPSITPVPSTSTTITNKNCSNIYTTNTAKIKNNQQLPVPTVGAGPAGATDDYDNNKTTPTRSPLPSPLVKDIDEYHFDYKSLDRIGRGSYGCVRKCFRKSDNRIFACKTISIKHLTAREYQGVNEEIRILKSIHHPNVAQLIDVYRNDHQIKLVLELCDGGSLKDCINLSDNSRLNDEQVAKIIFNLAEAINHLHNHGVVHRDLKPQNILFTKEGVLKITDFGLASYVMNLPKEKHFMHTQCGTPHYVAPEVLSDDQYTFMADYWSLGVIAYYMLSGYLPFEGGKTLQDIYDNITSGNYNFKSKVWRGITPQAKHLVQNLMHLDPEKRYNFQKIAKDPWIRKYASDQIQRIMGEETNTHSNKICASGKRKNNKRNSTFDQCEQEYYEQEQQRFRRPRQPFLTNSSSSGLQSNLMCEPDDCKNNYLLTAAI